MIYLIHKIRGGIVYEHWKRGRVKRDDLNGIGNKGDKGILLYKLYEPVDGYELIVKLFSGSTEAFLEKDLKLASKKLDKIVTTW